MGLQAIARKLQEKEMKEERRRQKQVETNFEEEYFEDRGGEVFLWLCVYCMCVSRGEYFVSSAVNWNFCFCSGCAKVLY